MARTGRATEAIPQVDYWVQVPGLVRDGCAFSWSQTKAFYQHVHDKYRGSPALSQPLAGAEDGGASTDYSAVPGANADA